MKKIVILIITVVMLFALCACKDKQPEMLTDSYGGDRFVKVANIKNGTDSIFVDKETGVEYWFHEETVQTSGLTPLLNGDGSPILYHGDY